MDERGYIKLWRKIDEDKLWTQERFTRGQAWVDLLIMAMHKDQELTIDYKNYPVPMGSFVTSQRKLARRWKWSISTVNVFLKYLQKTERKIEHLTEHSITHIYIVNWKIYQGNPNALPNEKKDTTRTVAEQLPKQIKNDKNDTNDNNEEHIAAETQLQVVVNHYKVKRGNDINDKSWDKVYFPRCSRSAKTLIDFCGSPELACACIDYVAKDMIFKKLDWTIETVVKHSDKWKIMYKKKDENERKLQEETKRAVEFAQTRME